MGIIYGITNDVCLNMVYPLDLMVNQLSHLRLDWGYVVYPIFGK